MILNDRHVKKGFPRLTSDGVLDVLSSTEVGRGGGLISAGMNTPIPTVDGSEILLTAWHLWKPVNNRIFTVAYYQLVPDFFYQQYGRDW